MIRNFIYCLSLSGILITSVPGIAQHSLHYNHINDHKQFANGNSKLSSDSIELISQIRESTRKFKDMQIAIDEGYLPFGPDMPNMGEHFVNPSLAVSRELNITRPSVLTYLSSDDEMVLTGVAYTLPVLPDEHAPDPPFKEAQWHYHSGNLLEEAHGLHHHSMHDEKSDKTRLGMLHAWVWTDNPDGMFTADNWALNLQRLGSVPSIDLHPSASKALFLLYSGVDYYTRFVELASNPNTETLYAIREQIQITSSMVVQVASRIQNRGHVLPEDEQVLIEMWNSMWEEIKHISDPQIWYDLSKYLTESEFGIKN